MAFDMSQALPIMVNNYAKLFGITVKMQGSLAYTNGKVITIPRLDINNPVKSRLAYGFLAHESAHIRYTDFSLLKENKIKGFFLGFSLFNILEDSRIETLIAREYIGVYENLSLLNDYYEKSWNNFCSRINQSVLLNVVCSFVQTYAQSYCQKFSSSRKRAAFLYFHLRKRITPKRINQIAKIVRKNAEAKNSHDVNELVTKILNVLVNVDYSKEPKLENQYCKNDDIYEEISEGGHEEKSTFVTEMIKFKRRTKDDITKVTPSKAPSTILEENSNCAISSSREDLGLFHENECPPGRSDFINDLADTYGLRRALSQKVRAYVESLGSSTVYGRKIDPYKAQKACVGVEDIFKGKIEQTDFSTSFHVLVDVSCSMLSTDNSDKSRAYEACKAALMLALAIEGIDGIKSMVTFFPGFDSEFEVALRENERASSVSSRFDQKPRGSTPLAQSLWFAFKKAHALECNRNIILVITDGMPDSIANVKNCFEYAKNNGIEIYGLSIRSENILQLFEKAQVLDSASMLQEKAYSLLNELFDPRKYNFENLSHKEINK